MVLSMPFMSTATVREIRARLLVEEAEAVDAAALAAGLARAESDAETLAEALAAAEWARKGERVRGRVGEGVPNFPAARERHAEREARDRALRGAGVP